MRDARWIETWEASPELAMGLDEALLLASTTMPVVRMYTWQPDTLSLGYFQCPSDVPQHLQASRMVRRSTGGGAIHHVHELTFSIAAPVDDPLYKRPLPDSYAVVHTALAVGLQELGVKATLRGAATLQSEQAGTGMCFHESTPLDLVWDQRKGVGSAQRRKLGRVLHHGSLKLQTSVLDTAVATLPEISALTLARLLKPVLAAELGLRFLDGPATVQELATAAELGRRFTAPEWLTEREA